MYTVSERKPSRPTLNYNKGARTLKKRHEYIARLLPSVV